MLPSPRFLKVDEIYADEQGNPVLDHQLFLLDCHIPPDMIKMRYPSLWDYLEIGREKGIPERYLCKHRTPWYVQEDRPPSPFVCTYMGRGASEPEHAIPVHIESFQRLRLRTHTSFFILGLMLQLRLEDEPNIDATYLVNPQ